FKPKFLVISLGYDTYYKDRLGDFKLSSQYYMQMAKEIKQLGLPIVIIQEGGYHDDIGLCAESFALGLI
ncbi:MAG: histone deacetylase family protein, partial [bacterium]|nr:histone deacetylase family protein [bacterium]